MMYGFGAPAENMTQGTKSSCLLQVRQLGYELGSSMLQNVPIFGVEAVPHPAVVAASDAVAVNIHPFFHYHLPNPQDPYEMATLALQGAKEVLNSYRAMFPGKRLIITEIGWPTSSEGHELHSGKMETTKAFMQVRCLRYHTKTCI